MDLGQFKTFRSEDGRRLTFWRDGRGPLLVLHPGGPGLATSAEFFDFCGLADHFTLIKINPRGMGGSGRPTDKRAYSLGDYADDLEQSRIFLDVERFSLFGTSHGGAVSIAYSVAYPNRVDRLILCATRAGRFDTDEGERVKAIKIRSGEPWFPSAMQAYQRLSTNQWETEEDLSQLVIRSLPLAFGHFGGPLAATLEAGREAFSHPNGDLHRGEEIPEPRDRVSDLEHIRAPTLVFQGTEDPLVPKRHGEEIARRVRGARLVLLEGVGHSFPWVDGRDRMREEIVTFLSRI